MPIANFAKPPEILTQWNIVVVHIKYKYPFHDKHSKYLYNKQIRLPWIFLGNGRREIMNNKGVGVGIEERKYQGTKME